MPDHQLRAALVGNLSEGGPVRARDHYLPTIPENGMTLSRPIARGIDEPDDHGRALANLALEPSGKAVRHSPALPILIDHRIVNFRHPWQGETPGQQIARQVSAIRATGGIDHLGPALADDVRAGEIRRDKPRPLRLEANEKLLDHVERQHQQRHQPHCQLVPQLAGNMSPQNVTQIEAQPGR